MPLGAITVLPYSRPLSFQIEKGNELPSLLAVPCERFDERVVVRRPFNIPRLTRVMGENAIRLSEGTYLGQTRFVFYQDLDPKRVPNTPFPYTRQLLLYHADDDLEVSLHLRAKVWCESRGSGVLERS